MNKFKSLGLLFYSAYAYIGLVGMYFLLLSFIYSSFIRLSARGLNQGNE